MDEATRNKPITGGSGPKLLALLGVVLIFGISLYVSREWSLPPATGAANIQKDEKPAASTSQAVMAANRFLDSLDARQKEKAILDYNDPKKPNWSNLPVNFVLRNGVRLGDLTKEQRARAMEVVAAVLSKGGYQKVVDIIEGDQLLAEGKVPDDKGGKGGKDKGGKSKEGKGGKGGAQLGADYFYLAIFGKPSEKDPWMVQFGGHHLGINVTVIGKHFVLTPSHTGAQPILFKRNGKEVRPLGEEIDAAFKLIGSLSDRQRAQAVIGEQAQNLEVGPGQDGKKIEPKGIKGDDLKADQQAMLLDVIAAWVNIAESDTAAARMMAIKEKINETYFAWSGPTTKGSAVYFRVQGPSIVIEYAPQPGAEHIHTVIRNPEDDYGAGILKRR